MGLEIVYCARCGERLTAQVFKTGRAFTFSNRNWCRGCVVALKPSLSPEAQASLDRLMKHKTDALKAVEETFPEEEFVLEDVEPTGMSARTMLLIGAAGAPIILILFVLILAGSDPVGKTHPAPTQSPVANQAGREASRKESIPELDAILTYARQNPEDCAGVVREFEHLLGGMPPESPAYTRVSDAMLPYKQLHRAQLRNALGRVEDQIALMIEDCEFGRAIALVKKSDARRDEREWKEGLQKLTQRIEREIRRAWIRLVDAAIATEDAVAARKLVADAYLWGIEEYSARADRLISQINKR